ncbi:DUF6894 family protein [Microvirga tunisiensis]|jgi:hypothetical protein|uniref:DUF6894 family protein n=1 Tax=Microvirga tunisiensis TaxID=2108360 RepID=UPI003B8483F5
MHRYFFNVRRDGVLIPDREGDELPGVDAVQKLGLDTVQDMIRLPHIYGEIASGRRMRSSSPMRTA